MMAGLVVLPMLLAFDQGTSLALPPRAPRMGEVHSAVIYREGRRYLRLGYFADKSALKGKGNDPLAVVLRGSVWSGVTKTFLLDVGPAKREAYLLELLKRYWPEKGFDASRPGVVAFLKWERTPLNEGATVRYLFDDAGKAYLDRPGATRLVVRDVPLVIALRAMHFTPGDSADDPVQRFNVELRYALGLD